MTREETVQDVRELLREVKNMLSKIPMNLPPDVDLVQVWELMNDSVGLLSDGIEIIDECTEE